MNALDPSQVYQQIHCRRCGAALSGPLLELLGPCPVAGVVGQDALPRGVCWRAEADVGLPAVHVGDLVTVLAELSLRRCGSRTGCCGPDGLDGPNLACACGVAVGTELSDCYQAHYVALSDVVLVPTNAGGRRILRWQAGPTPTVWELSTWLHEALGLSDWLGEDLAAIAAARTEDLLVVLLCPSATPGSPAVHGWADRLRAGGLDVLVR